jgi:hypothetical protein
VCVCVCVCVKITWVVSVVAHPTVMSVGIAEIVAYLPSGLVPAGPEQSI